MTRTRTRTRRPTDPRDQAEALGYDTGSRGIAVEVEHVAIGTRATHPRARRADPLNRVADCTAGMRTAAALYRRAYEHCEAGRGMGPMDAGAERVQEHRRGDGVGVALLPQEAAMSAAEVYRRGVQAMGLAASQGVVNWVVVRGGSLASYDEVRRWKEGRGKAELLPALQRLAEAYDCA
jgi:hypothetical protein